MWMCLFDFVIDLNQSKIKIVPRECTSILLPHQVHTVIIGLLTKTQIDFLFTYCGHELVIGCEAASIHFLFS